MIFYGSVFHFKRLNILIKKAVLQQGLDKRRRFVYILDKDKKRDPKFSYGTSSTTHTLNSLLTEDRLLALFVVKD